MEEHEDTIRTAIQLFIMIEEDGMEVFTELNSRERHQTYNWKESR